MALGFDIRAWVTTDGTDPLQFAAEYWTGAWHGGPLSTVPKTTVASWSGLDATDHLESLVASGDAVRVRSGGYPSVYITRADAIAEFLTHGTAALDAAPIAQPVVAEAWDQS